MHRLVSSRVWCQGETRCRLRRNSNIHMWCRIIIICIVMVVLRNVDRRISMVSLNHLSFLISINRVRIREHRIREIS